MRYIHIMQVVWAIGTVIAWAQIFLVRRQLKRLRRQTHILEGVTTMTRIFAEQPQSMKAYTDLKKQERPN